MSRVFIVDDSAFVRRAVTRLVTPGTITEERLLESGRHNYLAALVKIAAQFPRIVEAAALAHEPHRIAFYLGDLVPTAVLQLPARTIGSGLKLCWLPSLKLLP